LVSQDIVVIDGSRFKRVNNRNRNVTRAKMKRLADVEASFDRTLNKLEIASRLSFSAAVG
jgi:hypothetical protein